MDVTELNLDGLLIMLFLSVIGIGRRTGQPAHYDLKLKLLDAKSNMQWIYNVLGIQLWVAVGPKIA